MHMQANLHCVIFDGLDKAICALEWLTLILGGF